MARSISSILRFHAVGQWDGEQVLVHRSASSWRANPAVNELIDKAWEGAMAQSGVHLFDGPMCRLESWRASAERLEIVLSDTTYKKFLGTNLTHPELAEQFGRHALANPVGVSPALITADNFLMMGRRNGSVAYYPHRVHPFAGALDPADDNPFTAIRRELAEELSFTNADISNIACTGIAEDIAIRQPELIFTASSPRTRAEIEAAFDRTEHHATWSTPATAEAIEAALRPEEVFTPVAIAAMLLYGRVAFGEAFFERCQSAKSD